METDKVEHLTIKPVDTGNYRYTIEIDKSVFELLSGLDQKRNDVCNSINRNITTIIGEDLLMRVGEVYEGKKGIEWVSRCSRSKYNQIKERFLTLSFTDIRQRT